MYILENDILKLEFKDDGAELIRIFNKMNNIEYLWEGDPKYWGRQSPILFPIVGKLKDNTTYIEDEKYIMTQHGFARDMKFNLVEKSDNSILFELQYNNETLKKYPYKFKLLIGYYLSNNEIKVKWIVKNLDDKEIYFSIGAHPAFNIPLMDNTRLEDYYLSFKPNSNTKQFTLKDSLIDSQVIANNIVDLPITPRIFKDDALIYSNIDKVSICCTKNKHSIDVYLPNFPFVGIWSPYYKDNDSIAPFICIEPWYGIADMIDTNSQYINKFGINKIAIKEEFVSSYKIAIN